MDENNIIKKKKKNYYRRHNNQNRNYYKNKKKKNLIYDNNDTQEIKNILLFNETTKLLPKIEKIDLTKKELPKVEIPVIKAYELLKDKNIYNEEEIVPKTNKNKIKLSNPNVLKFGMVAVVLMVLVLGSSYSFFNYTKEDTRQADISSGEVYVNLMNNENSITLDKMYPRSDSEARSRNDNYFDFTIKAKNTSETKAVLYDISINNGTDISGKTRINPKYISVDLEEKVGNTYKFIKEGVTLDNYNYTGYVPINTTSEITKEYRLRFWINDDIIISDTDSNRTYTVSEFNNLYANFNIEINSEDKHVAYTMLAKNADTETVINFGNASSNTNGKGLYRLTGTENDSFPIYYYRGEVDNNNVIFGGYCWQIVRTTETGGIKMIYNGEVTGEGLTCENTTANDRMIGKEFFKNGGTSLSDMGYMYNSRYLSTGNAAPSGSIFGKSIEWDGVNYLVVDDGAPSVNTTLNDTHHFTCGTSGVTSCSSVRFYFYNAYSGYRYVTLNNGETVEDILYKMTGNGTDAVKSKNAGYKLNVNDSTIKTYIDNWFKNNLTNEVDSTKTDYRSYIEDTIYCNDRSYQQTGNTFSTSGWNPNGGSLENYLYFNTRTRAYNNDWYSTSNVPSMTCPNKTDRFSVNNRSAQLKYPVGLLTLDEVIMAGFSGNINTDINKSYFLYIGDDYWTMSPSYMYHNSAFEFFVYNDGTVVNYYVGGDVHGVRPVISIKLDTIFNDGGDGTPTNPYVVKYN